MWCRAHPMSVFALKRRRATRRSEMRDSAAQPLQFAFLVAAGTIAAASYVIFGKTMSTASPDEAVEVEVSS